MIIQGIHFSTQTVTIVRSGQEKGVLADRLRGVPEGHEDVVRHIFLRRAVETLRRRDTKAMLIQNQKIFLMVRVNVIFA